MTTLASTNNGFPYSSGPLDSQHFTFDTSATGQGKTSAGFGVPPHRSGQPDEPPTPYGRIAPASTSTCSQLTQR